MKNRFVYLILTDNEDYYHTTTYHAIFSSLKKAQTYLELEKANNSQLGYCGYIVKEILE